MMATNRIARVEFAMEKQVVVILLGLFLLSQFIAAVNCFAQESNESQGVLVSAGTPIILEVDTPFSTEMVKEGDTIALRVRRPVRAKGIIVVRAGIAARASIVSCKSASGWGSAGEISLQIRSVQAIDGQEILLSGAANRKGDTDHGTATAVGVGAGVICLPFALTGFAIKGEQGEFPQGYEIVAHTDGDHLVKILSEDEQKKIASQQNEESRVIMRSFKERIDKVNEKKKDENQTQTDANRGRFVYWDRGY